MWPNKHSLLRFQGFVVFHLFDSLKARSQEHPKITHKFEVFVLIHSDPKSNSSTAMSWAQVDPSNVFTGFWVDWTNGLVLGSTITASSTTGTTVVALLAVLIQIAGSHLLDLSNLLLHRILFRSQPHDGLHHQRQVLLRNNRGPGSSLVDSMKLYCAWRGITRQPFSRIILPMVVAAFVGSGMLFAGIMSNWVVSSSTNDVLVRSEYCGYFHAGPELSGSDYDSAQQRAFAKYITKAWSSALTYSRSCYSASNTRSEQCNTYTVQQIPWMTTYDNPCPFQSSLCQEPVNSAMTLDTGVFDSHEFLGINAKIKDRVKIRKRTTCAPINTTGILRTCDCSGYDKFTGNTPLPGESCLCWEYDRRADNPSFVLSSYASNRTWSYLLE